ncbi:MAG: EamA family transporter [Candidatus Eremiobacteraeota bacterium]|nr:EamA family transporter [Candidatus Eremiobacteraeota bacterium]MCW5872430.1 EamA family transporter [Candidatus Eremiobacteraeota bacterium]
MRSLSGHAALYASCFFFAAMALSVKLCTQPSDLLGEHHMPPVQVVFFRSFLCLLILIPSLLKDLKTHPVRLHHIKPLLLRSLAGGLAMIAYFSAISRLPLATAVLLNYTSPLWAGLFAFVFLSEALSAGLLLAYPLALTGVLMVVGGPGVSDDLPAVGLGLASAVLAGAAYTALRGLRGTPASIVVTGLCLVSCVAVAPVCYANYVAPTPTEWGLLWACGLASAGAQVLMTLGFRTTKTAAASTVGLTTVAISGLLSCLLLGETLVLKQWLGIAVLLWATSQTGRRSLLSRVVRLAHLSWRRPAYRH